MLKNSVKDGRRGLGLNVSVKVRTSTLQELGTREGVSWVPLRGRSLPVQRMVKLTTVNHLPLKKQ